jgi:altronate dehydratase small subunit
MMVDHSIEAGASCIVMDEKDNVATLLRDVKKGESLSFRLNDKQVTITAEEDIKFGHKIALVTISKGHHVLKYGESIGAAITEIGKGFHVHVHNIEGIRGRGDQKVMEGESNQ